MSKLVKFKLLSIQKRINFFLKKAETNPRIVMTDDLDPEWLLTILLLLALIVKHTRKRNKKLKAVNKMCLKLCLEWDSARLCLSLKSDCIDCAHWPPASSSRADLCRKPERTQVSALVLDGPWIKTEFLIRPFQDSFICPNLKLSAVLLSYSACVNFS